jgi:guanosine-3',5'-bis(diphosphate) 3'-pyrophosphohydrolase
MDYVFVSHRVRWIELLRQLIAPHDIDWTDTRGCPSGPVDSVLKLLENDFVARAAKYAAQWHALSKQYRKYTREPYIAHPLSVASLVASVTSTEHEVAAKLDEVSLAAALLHDVVEDTACTLNAVREHFGIEVATLVDALTDVSRPHDGNRATRKALDRAHLAHASAKAKTIKLADLIDNTESILKHDPKFARIYLAEKRAVLEVLREGNPQLWTRADQLVTRGLAELGVS